MRSIKSFEEGVPKTDISITPKNILLFTSGALGVVLTVKLLQLIDTYQELGDSAKPAVKKICNLPIIGKRLCK